MLGHRPMVIEDYVAILKRRWWVVLLPLLVLPVLTYAFSYTIPPEYLSKELVLVESQKVPDTYVKPVVDNLENRLASMKEQMMSRSHLQPIIERYNLYGTAHMDMDDRIEMVRKDVDVAPIHSDVAHAGGLPGFTVTFKADDAHTAQLVCSEITSLFISEDIHSIQDSAEGTTDFLKGQLDNAKRNLDEQEAKVAAFERQYVGRLPGQESANSDMLGSLNTQLEATTQQLTRAEQDRSYVQSMLAQQSQPTVMSSGDSNIVLPAPTDPMQQEQQMELQRLLSLEADLTSHYTSDYPDVVAVKRKIADLRKQIAQSSTSTAGARPGSKPVARESLAVLQLRAQAHAMDVGIDAKRKEQGELQGKIRNYQERIEASPVIEEQYKEITRDHATAQTFYDGLQEKMNQSRMAVDLQNRQQGEQFHIQDPANLPDAPFSPKRGLFLGSGIAFGIIMGLAIAGLLEWRDTSLRSERDVWAFTKLPTLGQIAYADVIQRAASSTSKKPWRFLSFFKKSRQVADAQG